MEPDATALGVGQVDGYRVEAVDGAVGMVVPQSDGPGNYILVKVPDGGDQRVMLPLTIIDRIDHESRTIRLDLTLSQVEAGPGSVRSEAVETPPPDAVR